MYTVVDKFNWSYSEKCFCHWRTRISNRLLVCVRAQQRKLIAVLPTRTGYRRLARWKLICHLKLTVVGKNIMEPHYSLESKDLISNIDALW